MKKENIIENSLVIIICILIILFLKHQNIFNFGDYIISTTNNTHTAGELLPGNSYEQTFKIKGFMLKEMQINIATYGRINDGEIELILKNEETDGVLRREKINTNTLQDNSYLIWKFKPIINNNKSYIFTINVIKGEPGNAITIWLNNTNPYKDGSFLINGQETNDDMLFKLKVLNIRHLLIFSIGLTTFGFLLIICIKMPNKYKEILNQVHCYRYIIALVFLIILSILKINGSSIGMYDIYLPDKFSLENQSKIYGKLRGIRSDEWICQTPWYLSQTYNNLNLYNDNIGVEGANMSFIAPTKQLINLVKFPMYGFLLGKEFGLSWWWLSRAIALLLLSVELGLILTQGNKWLSWTLGFWILLSPPIQWWYSTPLVDIIYYGILMIICVNGYINLYKEINKKRYFYGIGLIVGALGVGSSIYPPFQIPMICIILSYIIAQILIEKKLIWEMIVKDFKFISIMIIGLIIIYSNFLYNSKNIIESLTQTVYPGNRIIPAGYLPFSNLNWYLVNWLIPFKDVNFSNNSEASQFISFWPIAILLYIINFRKITDKLIHVWFITLIILLSWIILPCSNCLGNIFFFKNVQAERMLLFVGLLTIFLIIALLSKPIKQDKIYTSISVILIAIYTINSLYKNDLTDYLNNKIYIILTIIYSITFCYIIFNKKIKIFCFMVLMMCIISGLFVNPINIGVDSIYNKELAYAIEKIKKDNYKSTWLITDIGDIIADVYGNYLIALGIKVVNPVLYTPQLNTWYKLDPERKYEEIYNRYAHITVELIEDSTYFKLINPDAFRLYLKYEDLKKLNINYIITGKEIYKENIQLVMDDISENNYKIYKVLN